MLKEQDTKGLMKGLEQEQLETTLAIGIYKPVEYLSMVIYRQFSFIAESVSDPERLLFQFTRS